MLKKNTTLKSYLDLTKPRITFFCVLMTAGGVILARGNISILCFLITLLGTALSVASANTFNMILERHIDKLMKRTRFRPLATGRIKVTHAMLFALLLAIASIFLLAFYVNPLTALLSLSAILAYSFVYTPLKVKTPLALVIGALPGAIPPLLGWTAVTNKIDLAGLSLFGILFAWQMPHFIAISLNHKEDYARAGIKVVPIIRGDFNAKVQSTLWTLCLFIISLTLVPLRVGSWIYFIFAFVLGLWFLYYSVLGFKKDMLQANWARKFFFASLCYLPILILGLVIDHVFN